MLSPLYAFTKGRGCGLFGSAQPRREHIKKSGEPTASSA